MFVFPPLQVGELHCTTYIISMILTGHILFTPCLAEILHASAILVTVSGKFFFSTLTDAEMIPN